MDLEQDRSLVLDEVYRVYVEFGPDALVKVSEIAEQLDLDRLAMEKALHWLAGHGYIVWSSTGDAVTITASGVDAIEQVRQSKTAARTTDESERPIEERYVFISHSSKDSTVVSAAKQAFQDLSVKLYFIEDKPRGAPPSREIAQAVKHAEALFLFWTYNSIIGDTRDWIVYEIGVAIGHDRPVYSWKQRSLPKEQLPKLLEQTSTYREFELSGDGTIRLTGEIRDAAKNL